MSGAFCCIAMARIKLKNSQVKDKAPLATDLDVGGEIAVNHHADNPGIFLKDTAGAVRKIAGPGSISTSAATEAAAGIVELATLAETATGTDVTRAVHPAGLKALLSATLTPGSATAPAAPATGATYIDSSVSPAVVAVWDGAAWVKQVGTATTSATAPTAPVTGQVYLDTSTSPAVAKLWNGGAWINLTTDTAVQSKLDAQLGGIWSRTGTVLSPANAGDVVNISAGTEALPGLTPVGDPNTGIYSPGAGQVAISTGGSGRLFVDANGNIGVKTSAPFQYGVPAIDLAHIQLTSQQHSILTFGGTAGATGKKYWRLISRASETKFQLQSVDDNGNSEATAIEVVKGTAHAIDNVQLHTNGSERLRIDSQGRLLVGASSARNTYFGAGISAGINVEGAGSLNIHNRAISVVHGNSAGIDGDSILYLGRTRSDSIGGTTIVQDNDQIGRVAFVGADGTNMLAAAQIQALVDGTPGAGDMPGRLVFSVTAGGASSPVERMRVKSNGTINFSYVATYVDNTAAKAGGLVAGDIYRKADGTLMITF
jgi:hypothetical protein